MPNSIPYKGLGKEELDQVFNSSEEVVSFAGAGYLAMHKSTIQEIQAQKDRNDKAAQKGMHMTINSNLDKPLHLQPDTEELMNRLVQTVQENEAADPVEDDQIRDMRELATFCITTETQAEPKAECILVRGEHARSRKLYNIRFNLKSAVALLFDWLLLGKITENTSLQLIVMLIVSIAKLYDLMLAEFGTLHAAVLQELYRVPKENGTIEEGAVIQRVLERYNVVHPDWDDEAVREAITQLDNYHCIELINGNLTITESIVIQ